MGSALICSKEPIRAEPIGAPISGVQAVECFGATMQLMQSILKNLIKKGTTTHHSDFTP